ncbi:MAG: NACHT domain-containing protein [Cyanobacteria bacterium J06560_6]
MSESSDKIANKVGIHAPSSQVNIENMFVGSGAEPAASQSRLVDWQKICRKMLADREQLTSNRLMSSPDMHKNLDIFVDLALVQQTKADKRDGDVLPEHGSKLYEPSRYAESERFEFSRFLEEVLSVQKNEKLTIVGEPGSGKTTLLQKVAFWLLDNTEDLVIWVSLGELKEKSLRDYLTEDWLKDAVMYSNSDVIEDWEQQFLQRRVWLLLDGLDEMTPETRAALSLRGWISQARVIVTCRVNVWQSNPRIINGFQTYRMLEFRLPQIEEFTQKWFAQDATAGQHLYQALNHPGKERIRDLVKNPLRLTLLCSTWHLRDRKLPDTRAELYEQFVDDLYEWKRDRFPTTAQQREELNCKLGELAKEAIDKELTRFRLRHGLVCKVLGKPNDPNSMLKIALELGWLNTVGVNPKNPREPVYSFFHATLQEYFATRNIQDWDFFLPKNHKDKPVQDKDGLSHLQLYRVFQPQWREVILLWLGRQDIDIEERYDFLEALLDFKDGCGGFYSTQLFFLAGLGILEVPNFPQSMEVIQDIVDYGFGSFDSEKNRWRAYLEPLEKQARITLLSTADYIVIEALSGLLGTNLPERVCYEAASLLCKIDFQNEKAKKILIELLESVENDGARLQISNSLIQISSNTAKAEQVLIEIAKTGKYEGTRRNAAQALLKIDPNHKIGIDVLLNILCTSEDRLIVWNLNLDDIDSSDPKLLRTLLQSAYSAKTWDARSASAFYLSKMFVSIGGSIENIPTVLKFSKLISNVVTPSEKLPSKGIECLRYIAELAENARSHKNKRKRRQSFMRLFWFTLNQPEKAMLVAQLAVGVEGGEAMKEIVIKLLKALDIDVNLVVPIWVDLINSINDGRLRSMFATPMAESGFEDEMIPRTLAQLLKKSNSDNDQRTVLRLAGALLKYDAANQNAISALTNLLEESSDDRNMCRWVADDLGEACNDNHALAEILLNLLIGSEKRSLLHGISLGLQNVFDPVVLALMVDKLKCVLQEKTYKDNLTLRGCAFEILWHCAYRLSYSDFYQAWHGQHANILASVTNA